MMPTVSSSGFTFDYVGCHLEVPWSFVGFLFSPFRSLYKWKFAPPLLLHLTHLLPPCCNDMTEETITSESTGISHIMGEESNSLVKVSFHCFFSLSIGAVTFD